LKVLLDENMPHTLRRHLDQHETITAAYMGWAGLKNGKLLDAAESEGFQVLVTGDKTLRYEQNLAGREIAMVSLSAVHWPLIEPHIAKILAAINRSSPGSFERVECGAFVRRRAFARNPDL
jgi:predicted nuclease of predicted toxin-antitoxin system